MSQKEKRSQFILLCVEVYGQFFFRLTRLVSLSFITSPTFDTFDTIKHHTFLDPLTPLKEKLFI